MGSKKSQVEKAQKPVGYYDIETTPIAEGPLRFLCAVVVAPDGKRLYARTARRLWDTLASYPGAVWYAHNSGRFDALAVCAAALDDGAEGQAVDRSGSLIEVRIGGVTLRDSYAAMRGALKCEVRDGKMVHGLQCVFGGEHRLKDEYTYETKYSRQLRDYCERDVLGLQRAMEGFAREIERISDGAVDWPRLSEASTSRAIYEAAHGRLEQLRPQPYARHALYGGRVDVFRTGDFEGLQWADIVSSYPYSAVEAPLPMGEFREGEVKAWKDASVASISHASVWVPEGCEVPPLPFRHEGRVYFPTGYWVGVFVGEELRAAAERGCKVQVHHTYVAELDDTSVARHCEHLFEVKARAAKDDPIREIAKRMLNAFLGKFGERQLRTLVRLSSEPPPARLMARGRGSRGLQWRNAADWRVWLRDVASYGRGARPGLYAHVTARARLRLLGALEASTGRVYCDTDCVVAERAAVPSEGKELGAWEVKRGVAVSIWAPKAYVREGSVAFWKGVPKNGAELDIRLDAPGEKSRTACRVIGPRRMLGYADAVTALRAGERVVFSKVVGARRSLDLRGEERIYSAPGLGRTKRAPDGRAWSVDEICEIG